MEHVVSEWYRRDGIRLCIHCLAVNLAWPDECPGIRMTSAQMMLVVAGQLNYRDGTWLGERCKSVTGFPWPVPLIIPPSVPSEWDLAWSDEIGVDLLRVAEKGEAA